MSSHRFIERAAEDDPILEALLGEMRRKRRVRARVRASAALFTVALVVGLGLWMSRAPATSSVPVVVVKPVEPAIIEKAQQPPIEPSRTTGVEIVQTDPSLLHRVSVVKGSGIVQQIDDAQLIETLHASCGQVGIIKLGGRTQIITECVVVSGR